MFKIGEFSKLSMLVLGSATECRRLNLDIECTKPDYGIWNKDNMEDWLTEIQLPVK